MLTAAERKQLEKVQSELKHIGRLTQEFESDFELVDSLAHSAQHALELLFDLLAEHNEEIPAAVSYPTAA